MLELNQVYNMDCLEGLKLIEDNSIHCCVTSPPYWSLRDYDIPSTQWLAVTYAPMPGMQEITVPEWTGCLGLEPTIEMFIGHIVLIFREVRRVLRKDGTLWLNFGDSYCSTVPGTMGDNIHIEGTKEATRRARKIMRPELPGGLKPKDLMGQPWRVAFALQADGWYLRQDIIWAKPNPMPESVSDRCTKSHEHLFLLSKSRKYYYAAEAIKEPCIQDEFANGFRGGAYCNNETFDNEEGGKRKSVGNYHAPSGWDFGEGAHGSFHREGRRPPPSATFRRENSKRENLIMPGQTHGSHRSDRKDTWPTGYRNKRDVWTVATQPFPEAHFATFPPKLIEPCILAGCPVGGVTLDPFMGSGTTGKVALENQRNYLGFDLNPEYIKIHDKRTEVIQIKMV